MIQDEYREHRKIDNEYKKLLTTWNNEQQNNPSANIKRSRINRSEHVQFTLIHLFNDFLNQVWSGSQSMIQCAENWGSQKTDLNPTDNAFTMNIHGLHFMKQSLRKRQQLFKIVDELNNIRLEENEKSDEFLYSSSDSTISQDFLIRQRDLKTEYKNQLKIQCELAGKKNTQKGSDRYFDHEPNQQTFIDSALSFDSNRPIRLISSPSTPIVSNRWEEVTPCAQNFTPACNFATYFPRDDGAHKLSCHFCREMIPIKKSFSVENLNSFQQNLSNMTDDEDGYGNNDDSSFDITSLYCQSKGNCPESILERELFLKSNDQISISEQYRKLNDTEGSQKIEIEQDRPTSPRTNYCSTNPGQKQIKIDKKSIDIPVISLRPSNSIRDISTKKLPPRKNSLVKNTIEKVDNVVTPNTSPLANKQHKVSNAGASVPKTFSRGKINLSASKKIDSSSASIVRSFSSKNINLCNMFSTRKLNVTTPINK